MMTEVMWFMPCLAYQVNRATSMTGVDPCTDYEEDQPVASAYVNDVRTYKSVATHVDRSNTPVASVQFLRCDQNLSHDWILSYR